MAQDGGAVVCDDDLAVLALCTATSVGGDVTGGVRRLDSDETWKACFLRPPLGSAARWAWRLLGGWRFVAGTYLNHLVHALGAQAGAHSISNSCRGQNNVNVRNRRNRA